MNEIIRQTAPYPTEYTFQKLTIQRELMTSQTDLKQFIRNEQAQKVSINLRLSLINLGRGTGHSYKIYGCMILPL